MPAWVEQLMYTCKFLFPFDIRRRFFYCTSSGLFRALQHLQQQHSIEGLSNSSSSQDRDLRFSRIQRAKAGITILFKSKASFNFDCAHLAPLALIRKLHASKTVEETYTGIIFHKLKG